VVVNLLLIAVLIRKWGVGKWRFSPDKSYLGTLTFVSTSFIGSVLMLEWFRFMGMLDITVSKHLVPLVIISVACGIAELVPAQYIDDNVIVPGVGAAVASQFF
jgi:dolichol kinase